MRECKKRGKLFCHLTQDAFRNLDDGRGKNSIESSCKLQEKAVGTQIFFAKCEKRLQSAKDAKTHMKFIQISKKAVPSKSSKQNRVMQGEFVEKSLTANFSGRINTYHERYYTLKQRAI